MRFSIPTAVVADPCEAFRADLAAQMRCDLGFAQVIETGSLDDAIEHICRPDVSLASFDLALPGMSGLAILHVLRHAFPALRIAVIADSSKREDMLCALEAGVHGYVPKTFRFSEIAEALRVVIAGRIFVPWSLAKLAPGGGAQEDCSPVANPLELTFHQLQVLHLMAGGQPRKAIAKTLKLAEDAVTVHLGTLFRGLGVHNRLSALDAMTELGLARVH